MAICPHGLYRMRKYAMGVKVINYLQDSSGCFDLPEDSCNIGNHDIVAVKCAVIRCAQGDRCNSFERAQQ